ncbi:putative sulfate permease C3H7.02 [Golovinomyces cichoracearum]|uniref:Putative sulfate permease C3H7.02 n=1 Tax=Golovinomyces cichoracearum TaxID=62708 RepID=A0A420HFL0_9PEZI|nr:putative sulfate permease C3H7.02 [Golovinomyces cichoracearum]
MLPTTTKAEGPKLKLKDRIQHDLKTDPNLAQVKSLAARAATSLPTATLKYFVDKFPIFRWIPKYSAKWLVSDIVAGTTIGLLLIPQSLAYAKIADIPEEYGLMSSWIPPLVYALMGTSKVLSRKTDLCPGPTSIIGVLVAEVINDYKNEGYSPQQIAGVLTFLVGLISLVVGMLKMGFVLSFISVPVLSGFVSAAGLLTILSQVSALFGYTASNGTARKIYDIFAKLPKARLYDSLIGLGSILILFLTEKFGKRWGKKYKIIWIITICRNAILIMIFTIISFLVNKDADEPYFAIAKTSDAEIQLPTLPPSTLIFKLLKRSIAIFVAMALEHMAIAKTFAQKNKYEIDGSQELVFLGVSNLLNGFFPTIPGGGSFSRSAVNSDSGVKTPFSGIITSGFVLISLYFLTGALYWIPKAALAGVIITAVWSLLLGPSTFYRYWRISFSDFVTSMIAFWVTLFVSIEIGVALAVLFNFIHVIFRMVLSPTTNVTTHNWPMLYEKETLPISTVDTKSLLKETIIFVFKKPIIFLNAERTKVDLMEACKKYFTILSNTETESAPKISKVFEGSLWCETNNSSDTLNMTPILAPLVNVPLPQPLFLILDLSHVLYIDVTGIQSLTDTQSELNADYGSRVQWRLVGLRSGVRARLERAGWKLKKMTIEDSDIPVFEDLHESAPIATFNDMHSAIQMGRIKM